MVKKIKDSQCKGRWCQNHIFSIKTKRILIDHNPIDQTIRLCPEFNKQKKVIQKIIPIINLDKKYYTPLFILQQDKCIYTNHDERNRQIFENNKMQEQYQLSQIMVPRINSQRKYCKICKDHYTQYLDHIQSFVHMKLVYEHPYSAFIAQLVENVKQQSTKDKSHQVLNEKSIQSMIDLDIESALQEKQTSLRDKQIIIDIEHKDVNDI